MKRVLLVSPGFNAAYGDAASAATMGTAWPPMGLAYLASNLRGDYEAEILDVELDPDLHGALTRFRPHFVGVTFTTPLYNQAMELFAAVKAFDTSIWTFAGGPHATLLPDSVISSAHVDAVLPGEGEVLLNKFLQAPLHGVFPREPLIGDLDSIAFPAREKLGTYQIDVGEQGLVPMATLMTTRGCPYLCTFCSQSQWFGRKVRYRSVENCMEEIREIKRLGISHLVIVDDTLGLHAKKTLALCDALIDAGLGMTFEGWMRANVVTRGLLEPMKAAGLVRLSFGVETGDKRILDEIKRGTTLDQVREACELTDQMGIETRISLMLGLPFESKRTVRTTLDFIKSLKCNHVYINLATPFPGTELYEQALAGHGGLKLLAKEWKDHCRWGRPALRVNDLGPDDLLAWQRRALMEFYLRPDQIRYHVNRSGWKDSLSTGVAFLKNRRRRGKR